MFPRHIHKETWTLALQFHKPRLSARNTCAFIQPGKRSKCCVTPSTDWIVEPKQEMWTNPFRHKLELLLTVGSTHLISASSWCKSPIGVACLDIKWCSRYSACWGISISANPTAAALTGRSREFRLFKNIFFLHTEISVHLRTIFRNR